MRDIRTDLQERLAAVQGRFADEMARYQEESDRLLAAHQAAMRAFEREQDAVRTLLAIEDERAGRPVTVLPPTMRLPLGDFLVEAVKAHGMMSKDGLRERAAEAGYLDEATGRTLHFTLLNIVKAGRLTLWQDGLYGLPGIPATHDQEAQMTIM